MSRRIGNGLIGLGICCVLISAGFFLFNQWEETKVTESAKEIMPLMVEAIVKQEPPEVENIGEPEESEIEAETEPAVPAAMKCVEIDGHTYIGFLTVEVLELELPIMADWSYPKLKINPCRFYGSTFTNDLVLMAHNYSNHFGGLSNLHTGDRVSFTDMDGHIWEYEVDTIEIIGPNDVETVTSGEFDLILFTCTYGGKTRVMVGCNRISTS